MCPQVRQSQPAPSPFQPSQPSQPCRASVAGAVAVTYARLLATPPDVPPMRDPREHVRSKSKKGFEGTVQEKTPLFCKRWSICGTVGGRAGDEPGGTHVIRWPRADACAGRCVWRAHACAELLHPSAFGFYPSFPFFYFSIFLNLHHGILPQHRQQDLLTPWCRSCCGTGWSNRRRTTLSTSSTSTS